MRFTRREKREELFNELNDGCSVYDDDAAYDAWVDEMMAQARDSAAEAPSIEAPMTPPTVEFYAVPANAF